ncbi:ABC transporter ATP-binding protein [Erysipelothrix sp. HDW6A]|uniref:ABC transporter ATP-binding protein n=1 Tax=Erysipelothrix sp. HDW6A TaxID=2714928 RepID=UPI00140E05D0|nr:ABC transporter ATP-binding protein [Erysipelothrix sp. HDW6A]QIK57057.1 ABC transporter ATP-binding protein [Erysipelothrix sp. HDW6A]
MKSCLKLKDVSVMYKDVPALNNISFDVKEGEIFGFLGPSGAGKTTTIKALTKQLKTNSGTIELFGKSLNEYKDSVYDKLGIMSDSNDIYENLSVYDNLKFFAEIKGIDECLVNPLLEKVNLFRDRKKIAKNLSRGMRQRLILATAIIHQPKLLFLDEPTAALDPKTTADIHELFMSLNKSGTTIFLTTHSMEEAEKLCGRIAFLDQGSIVEMGSQESLKLKYAHDEIVVQFEDYSRESFSKDHQGLLLIANKSIQKKVMRIHSNEPSLEMIFLTVTGRDNYEIA